MSGELANTGSEDMPVDDASFDVEPMASASPRVEAGRRSECGITADAHNRYITTFRNFDKDNDNLISYTDMVAAFGHLGLLNGLNVKQLGGCMHTAQPLVQPLPLQYPSRTPMLHYPPSLPPRNPAPWPSTSSAPLHYYHIRRRGAVPRLRHRYPYRPPQFPIPHTLAIPALSPPSPPPRAVTPTGEMLGLGSDTASRLRTYSPHDFVAHCGTLAAWHARAARTRNSTVAGVPPGAEHSEALRAVYARYAVGPGQGRLVTEEDYVEPRMGGGQLQRLAQDLGLMQPNGGWSSGGVGELC